MFRNCPKIAGAYKNISGLKKFCNSHYCSANKRFSKNFWVVKSAEDKAIEKEIEKKQKHNSFYKVIAIIWSAVPNLSFLA